MAGGFEEDTFAKDKPQEQSLKQDASGKNNSSGMPKMPDSNLQDGRDILCKNAAPCCISKRRKDDLECCRFSGNAHIACTGNDLGMKMPARNSKNINTIGFQGILAKPRTFPFSYRRHKVPKISLPFASYWYVMLATLWNNLHLPAPCSPARKLRNHSYGCCNHFLKRTILKFHRRRQYHVQKSISTFTNLFYRALKFYINLAYLGMAWRRKRMVTKVFYTKHTRKVAKRSRAKKVKRARKNWDLEKSTLSTPQVKMKNYLDDCIIVEEAHTKGLERKRSLDLQDLNLLTPEVKIAAYQDDCILMDKTFHTEEADIKSEQPPVRNSEGNNYENRDVRLHGLRHLHLRNSGDIAAAGFYLNGSGLLQCNGCRRAWSPAEVSNDPYGQDLHYSWCRYLLSRHGARNNLPRQIVSDGMVSDDARDPPGQQSIYIPPGDTRSESYRLSTFEHFPVACPISRKSLAKSGFFFTGFYDRVKCFACGRTVERWEETDNPAELRWHKPDCPFPRGGSCGNVPVNDLFERLHTNPITRQQQAQQQMEQVLTRTDPNTGAVLRTVRYPADLPQRIRQSGGTFEIGPGNSVIIQSGPGRQPSGSMVNIGNSSAPAPTRRWRMANVVSADHKRFLTNLHLNRELDRLTSFARWPVSRPNVSPALLAKSGFFYLGDMDRTQCFSCGGVLRNWTIEDDPQEEHQTHFQRCHLVQGIEARNVPIPQIAESAEDRMRLYPCRYPASPHMRHEATRLGTFDDRWPADRVRATPENISQAGFFFLGERDRAKCWYCNGGLQNWEYEDDPWEEHAKWFPNCQFLLQSKGQAFVYRHLAMNPHLARPIIARQEGSTIDPAPPSGEVVAPLDIPPSGPEVRPPSPPPVIVDPREELRKKKERVERIAKSSEICKNVIAMGFSEDVVKRLLEERIDAGNEADPEDIYESTSALLDDVMKKEEEMRREAEEEEARNQSSMMSSVPSGFGTNLSSLTSSVGPAPGSGRYNVSFYDEDEPMDDIELYGSMAGPLSMLSAASGKSGAPAEGKHSEKNEGAKESLQEQLQKIEEERLCKICFTNVADMVYIPCGHMCCCLECTQAIRQCPICRKKIEKAIKTYSS